MSMYEQELASNLSALWRTMKKHDIVLIETQYSGYGDSGQCDHTIAYDSNNNHIESIELKLTLTTVASSFDKTTQQWNEKKVKTKYSLHEAVEEIVYHLLETHHPGWEINEGSNGLISFDLSTRTVNISHNEFYTESNHTEQTLDFAKKR